MAIGAKQFVVHEALDTFKKVALTPEDDRRITENARRVLRVAIGNIKKNHYWEDRTHELTNSHYTRIKKPYVIEIGARAKHAIFLAEGTKDHYVTTRKKKALSWQIGNAAVFSGGHFVSGIKAKPWLEKEVEKVMPQMKDAITRSVKRAINK